MKLGICDYGIGGIGLYQYIRSQVPVDIVYFSDSGFIPYGKVEEQILKKRMNKVIDFFHQQGVSKIAVACNSASTVIEETKDLLGILNFGIKSVQQTKTKSIGVVGGGRTIESLVFKNAFEAEGIKTQQANAQAISIHIEAGNTSSKEFEDDLHRIFKPFSKCPYLLLACSHYPAVATQIKNIIPSTTLIDPIEEMGNWMVANWQLNSGSSKSDWYTSGDTLKMKNAALKAFQQKIERIEHIAL